MSLWNCEILLGMLSEVLKQLHISLQKGTIKLGLSQVTVILSCPLPEHPWSKAQYWSHGWHWAQTQESSSKKYTYIRYDFYLNH